MPSCFKNGRNRHSRCRTRGAFQVEAWIVPGPNRLPQRVIVIGDALHEEALWLGVSTYSSWNRDRYGMKRLLRRGAT
jgi:hypothetical protein